jgi:hypothetical protein
MKRVDLLLEFESDHPSPFQCLIPDHVAVKGLVLQVKLGGEERTAVVYNVLEPLIEFDYMVDDKTLEPI